MVLRRAEFCSTALSIICHLVQVLLRRALQGQVQVSLAVVRFLRLGDPIVAQGVAPGHHPIDMTFLSISLSVYPGYVGKFCAI